MTMLRWLLLSVSLLLLATPAYADADPAATETFNLYLQACVRYSGSPASTRAWAGAHRLTPLVNPQGIAIFAGGSGGSAWQITGGSTTLVLAILAVTGGCAVYAEHADPASVMIDFNRLITTISQKQGGLEKMPDRTSNGQFGVRIMRVVVQVRANQHLRLFMLMTDERPGGIYQATLQTGGGGR